jgi:hypothetical protein
MGDGSTLSIVANFSAEAVPIERPAGRLLFESRQDAHNEAGQGELPGRTARAFLELHGE